MGSKPTNTRERQWYMDSSRLVSAQLDPLQRARVLEWYAERIWVATEEGSGEPEYHSKSYDPLQIELSSDGSGVAHSYVFNFHDGGRHHPFESLDQLEDWLFEEFLGRCQFLSDLGKDELP